LRRTLVLFVILFSFAVVSAFAGVLHLQTTEHEEEFAFAGVIHLQTT
jgi:hypothetical protein